MKKYNGLTVTNIIIAAFNWLVGLPVLICNLLGVWNWWYDMGYAYIALLAFPLLASLIMAIVSVVASYKMHSEKRLMLNVVCFVVSVGAVLFTFLISILWLW